MFRKKMVQFLFHFVVVFCAATTSSLNAEGSNRILNGSPATENQFPYMISLQRLREIHSDTRGHRCGGVLVTLQHALTAAICILDIGDGRMVPIHPDEYRIFAGSVLLTNDTSADRIRRIADTKVHPDYDTSTYPSASNHVNDIGVIIIGAPFFIQTVTPLSVTDLGSSHMVSCTLSGWGIRGASATATSTQLTYSQMLTINHNFCSFMVDSWLQSTQLCAWGPGIGIIQEAAGCTGDAGGPLVCNGGIAGILIETRECSNEPSRPQLYTRVSNYTTWINSVVIQPIPELGPEPSTVTPPTTLPTTTLEPPPAPAGASAFQPVIAVLAVIAITQIITANVINIIF